MKATPAFNLSLCQRFGVRPLEFDGRHDSLFHEYDHAGRKHMEYVKDRGPYPDVPYEVILADFRKMYPRWMSLVSGGKAEGVEYDDRYDCKRARPRERPR